MTSVREGMLCSLGNPLLDIQAKVDKSFVEKWGLKENGAIICDHTLLPMFEEIVNMCKDQLQFIPGGSAQNTIKVAQWMLKKPKATIYMGSIGKDKYGEILKQKAQDIGVNAIYQLHSSEPTGKCVALISGDNRSLVAHPAAASHFSIDHLDVPENWMLISGAQLYYITGFFIDVCQSAIVKIAEYACRENKPFAMNLAAPFVCQNFKREQMEIMPYLDFLFGNDAEATAFAKENDIQFNSVHDIALAIANLPKRNERRPRVVIITQGPSSVIGVWDQKVHEFPTPRLEKEKIVDTNGAGDAFVGGFLSQLVQGRPLEKCIEAGAWAARVIIQHSGCTFPQKCDYN